MAKTQLLKYFTRIAPPILWAGVIFMLSSMPDLGGPDKLWFEMAACFAHLVEYAILSICIYFALTGRLLTNKKSPIDDDKILIPWVLAAVYAVTDEIHQAFVPGRESSILDFLVDVGGIFFGLIMVPLLLRWLEKAFRSLKQKQSR